jgi:quercetin dioxygenase-like cupin family protein
MTDDEPQGGDPPCWAHLFDDAAPPEQAAPEAARSIIDAAVPVDLSGLSLSASGHGAAWTHQSEDLNANLLVFGAGEGVAEHVNPEVDVLLVGIAGEGAVDVDRTHHILRAGQALVIPKGARRATLGVSDRFAYLTCHRRRPGLWPTGRARPPQTESG